MGYRPCLIYFYTDKTKVMIAKNQWPNYNIENKVILYILGQTVLSSFRAKLSASEMKKIMWKHEMQFRIKNDLDGLEFPDCQGLFSYLTIYLSLSGVMSDNAFA